MHCFIITTCSKEDEGKIKEALLKEKLAACISSFDVNLTYTGMEKLRKERRECYS
ncbi:MAG: divalent cation tolerance protein CutA [Thermoplasmata archaeon]|nr:divalent cation tolerance protein CutA [Thermoplasmata archaeon]